jgi:hypothetical protein
LIEREISALTLRNSGAQQRLLEQEAFAVQGQPNAVALIVRALDPWQGECHLMAAMSWSARERLVSGAHAGNN